ncbi:endonuclease domain-containing protein [Sphingomonas mesophila]|uniref:endonuclease domain-containing protein n=1 Tax=Sphingomonas mesophila TaxID=2303576 RepID=UPI000E5792A0|nr:endonuclease domain-containing protein [Sphingomonas mesophila]
MPEFRPRNTSRAQELRNGATRAERRLWSILRARQLAGAKFSRQMPVGPYICDFLCREHGLVIEVDGGQHADSRTDAARDHFLSAQGLTVLRFWNNEVIDNLDGVAQRIAETLPTPNPSRKREGNAFHRQSCRTGPGGGQS